MVILTPKELRQRRLALGWSAAQLAAKVGVSAKTVSEWERGSMPIGTPQALEQILRKAQDRGTA